MNKFRFLFVLVLCIWAFNAGAQRAELSLDLGSAKNQFNILEKSPYKIKIKASFDKMNTQNVSTVSGNFIELGCPGFTKIYNIGKPGLPVLNKLIEVPYGAEVQVNVISYDEQDIDLAQRGITQKILPSQPSISKNAGIGEIPFYYDQAFYQTNAFNTNEMVTVITSGILRGVQVANMSIAPFRYNPVTNVLKVYNNLVFEVVFKHPDIALTEQMKEKYYSPYFESSLSTLINHTQPLVKDALTKYPVKYVIVSLTTFQSALQPFVYWKRQKGFNVVEQYYTSAPTAATVKTYIQGLYTAGTPSDPAPTFVLLVGDVAQIPTNAGIADNAHKTDLYFFTMDGSSDYLPDIYYGRFSATSTTHVTNQVNKTLQYEKYTMPKKTYMDTVVMVAGEDGSHDATYGNGQINYGTSNYFNAAHGMYSNTFIHPNNTESAAGANMRAVINKGVGYANYTAHCSSSGWAEPGFSTSQIASMYNADKYGLMVGNCCQSNTFNDSECFGEALLRKYPDKGAVGYIGGSDYTYWDEDYYWGVGKRTSITANPTYNASNLGAYDCMFHDHGEAKTKWFITNSQMIYAGNMAVEASSSTLKKYYWEIYHLMGDPSVMNYFSVPDPLTVSYTNLQNVGITSLVVNTEEDAYVAISHAGVLLDAELAPGGGVTTLNFSAINQADTLDVVVTKQNKQPYIGTLRIVASCVALDAEMVSINNPVATYSCNGISITPQVTVRNAGTTTLTSFRVTYQITGGSQQIYNWSGSLPSTQTVTIDLSPVTIPSGSSTFTATTSLPNNLTDQNTTNDSKSLSITANNTPVNSDFSGFATSSCTAPLSVAFTNNSTNATTYSWDFGDGGTSTDVNPTHNYTALGTYTVTLTASAGICGSDVETKSSYITVGSDAPVGIDGSRCGTGSVTLNATASGTINWYDAATGGNLLSTGASYSTPSLAATTNYYVEQTIVPPLEYVGKVNKETSATNHTNNSYYTIFNCYTPVVLKSVKVYASGAGNRIIRLSNSSGTTIQDVTVNLPDGESRATVNINIPVGTALRLSCGTTAPNLYRDNAGVSYPYNLNGKISITGTNASAQNYYYYFYDWEIESPSCSSARTEVTAEILPQPTAGFTSSLVAATADFTNTSTNATSYSWAFGDGATSTLQNPSHTYAAAGTYNVTLTATNGSCTSSISQNITVAGSGYNISGKTRYIGKANAGNPAPNLPTYNSVIYNIDNVIVTLKSYLSGTEIAKDTSDDSGNYQFNNIENGNYILEYDKFTVDSMLWVNGVNAIDVSVVKYLIASDTLLDPSRSFSAVYKKAANVDNNSSINAVDVARIKAKIGSPYSSSTNFPNGNWVALTKMVTVAGANVSLDLETISYGDYNASSSKYLGSSTTWGSGKAKSEDNIIEISNEAVITSDQTYFEVPLAVSLKMNDLSSLGLMLKYPDGYKLVDAFMPRTNGSKSGIKINPSLEEIIANDNDLLVTDENSQIRVVFATTDHFDVSAGDQLIVLGFSVRNDIVNAKDEFTLSGTGVVADQYGEENEGMYLVMPKVFMQGNSDDAGFEFSGYPNPVTENATISYNLPEAGTVRLVVYNSIGEAVRELVNETQANGKHSVIFTPGILPQGIYTFKLEFVSAEKSHCMVLKMVY